MSFSDYEIKPDGYRSKSVDNDLTDVPEATMTQRDWFVKVTEKMKSQRWRLSHLYQVVNEKGKVVSFKMRLAQKLLYLGMHYLNIVLKSRQHGITTFCCLLFLDICLFNSNTHACIIAHNKDDAKDFFTKKIMFA
jgi:hypothetical protein